MANSSKNGPAKGTTPRHLRDELVLAARTPGVLGVNDAGDPTRLSLLGDTPGSLGFNDHGSPGRLTLPGLKTFHAWLNEASVHLPPTMQVAYYYASGSKDAVMAEASKFIARWEGIEMFPYVPGASSGITIGVGYDIGQTSEEDFRNDWAQLARLPITTKQFSLGVSPESAPKSSFSLGVNTDLGLDTPKPTKMFPFQSPLFTPLDRLAYATRGKLSHAKALEYIKEVTDISIPRELSIQVFEECSLPKYYKSLVRAMPGVTNLPTGVQVALLSLVYNRGTGTKGGTVGDDILDSRWEMRELSQAVMFKDLVWIYWYFESMRRIWSTKADNTSKGLIKRRDAELALIRPYVAGDIQHEAIINRRGP